MPTSRKEVKKRGEMIAQNETTRISRGALSRIYVCRCISVTAVFLILEFHLHSLCKTDKSKGAPLGNRLRSRDKQPFCSCCLGVVAGMENGIPSVDTENPAETNKGVEHEKQSFSLVGMTRKTEARVENVCQAP